MVNISACLSVATVFQFDFCQPLCARRMGGLGDVSISITSAVVYGVSGGFFIMLIIFLVMMSCDYDCTMG